MSEFAGPSRVGYAGAYLQSLAYGGFLMGASAAYVANYLADNIWTGSPSLEWRLPFIIGGVLGVVALYFRRELDETPAFRELEEQVGPQGSERQGSLSAVLREHRPAVMFGFLLIGTLSIINIVFFQYWPTYLQVNLGHSANMALSTSLLAIIGAMIAIPLWGRFADRYGWQALFVCGGVASMISSIAAFSVLPSIATDSPLLLMVSLPAAIGVASLAGAVPGLLASLFPTAIRQSGYAIPYNIGVAVVAGLLPLSLAPLIDTVGVRAPLLLALFSCALLLVAAAWVTRIPLYLGRSTIATDPEIID